MIRLLTVPLLAVLVVALSSLPAALAHDGNHNWTSSFKLVNKHRNLRVRCHPGSWVWVAKGTYDGINCTNHAMSITPYSYGSGARINASNVEGGCETPNKVVVTVTSAGYANPSANIASKCES